MTTTTAPAPATPVAPLFRPAPVSGVGPDVDLPLAVDPAALFRMGGRLAREVAPAPVVGGFTTELAVMGA